MMVCSDHYRGSEFFAEYKKRRAQAVVLIADSSDRTWLERFPDYCREYGLTAMICNAAGTNGGGSCILSSAGEFLQLRTSNAEYKYLPDKPLVGFATI